MLTSAKERSALWDLTEFVGWLSTSEASFAHRSSWIDCRTVVTCMNFNFKARIQWMYKKNTYHIVLERPMLQLYGVLPCHFIVLIDNLIVWTCGSPDATKRHQRDDVHQRQTLGDEPSKWQELRTTYEWLVPLIPRQGLCIWILSGFKRYQTQQQ
jgi:hypothetical protein